MGVGHTDHIHFYLTRQPDIIICILLSTLKSSQVFIVSRLLYKRSEKTHYSTGATAHSNAYFGEGSGLVHLDSVQCSGLEYSLTDCDTMNSGIESSHSLGVGVKCEPGMYYSLHHSLT